jgi:hypothetical protein
MSTTRRQLQPRPCPLPSTRLGQTRDAALLSRASAILSLLISGVLLFGCGNEREQQPGEQRARDGGTSEGTSATDTASASHDTTGDLESTRSKDAITEIARAELARARRACRTNCAVAATTGCNAIQPNCVESCEKALLSACGAQWRALTICAATATVDDYGCDRQGASVLLPGICEAELTAVKRCLTGNVE